LAHLNIYVPDELAAELKSKAAKEGLSLSKFVVKQISPQPERELSNNGWGDYFERIKGILPADFEEPEDPLPEPIDWSFD
jgi:hypothetical protein